MAHRPNINIETIGKNLKKFRINNNYSVKEICDYLGYGSVQAVYKFEKGVGLPQSENLLCFMHLYNISSDDLIYSYDE